MRRVKISEVDQPRNGLFQIYVDYWWAVSHDEEVYFFGTEQYPFSSPQGNANELLARSVSERLTKGPDEHGARYENYKETRQIPVIYRPISISEYTNDA